jgi:hypothetical protein
MVCFTRAESSTHPAAVAMTDAETFCQNVRNVMPSAALNATIQNIRMMPQREWRERAAAHRERALRHTRPARIRRDRGLPHPIADFLFEYYPFPFALLEKWHPGIGVVLE